jgi:hypothetical protein
MKSLQKCIKWKRKGEMSCVSVHPAVPIRNYSADLDEM